MWKMLQAGLLICLFFIQSTAKAQSDVSVTWDRVVRSHCPTLSQPATRQEPQTGPRGPAGLTGRRGRPGKGGVPGPIGKLKTVSRTEIGEIFKESIQEVLQRSQNRFVLEIPDDYDVQAAYAETKPKQMYSEWTVFQRRMDGSVDFYRGWDDYVNGFGNENGEFWLGLEEIYQRTKVGYHELRIDMIEKRGFGLTAKYDFFKLYPSSENYKLVVNSYSGNATDSLSYHSNRAFSTFDAPYENHNDYCPTIHKGAWWYYDCQYSNLNGKYKSRSVKGMRWYNHDTGRNMYMQSVEMKFRRVLE